MEKTRDIAVLRSMGVTGGGIRSIYFTIGSVIGLTGMVSGVVLGLLTCLYIKTAGIALPAEYYIERLPVAVNALDVTLVALAALGAALIATIYPTSAVSSISPADGLRND
jgi:lipoprotein-releasing system permease protein